MKVNKRCGFNLKIDKRCATNFECYLMKVENTDEESGSEEEEEEEKEPDFVRSHHMFLRILNFLCCNCFFEEKSVFLI